MKKILLALIIFPCIVLGSTEIIKSPNDERTYEYFKLQNGIQVLLINDPNAEIAAASLTVGVGTYNNPQDTEGLAHFLEHMLFLGTKKYPDPNSYSQFISQHGGYTNAYTTLMDTGYLFTIKPEYLAGALDRFVQFFIAPNFDADLIERERNAVHSEYMLKHQSDDRRIWRVETLTANPDHPIVQFGVGNNETLADGQESIRNKLINFYNNYYSTDKMILVVVAPQSIAELTKFVDDTFATIKHKDTLDSTISIPTYTAKETGNKISIKAVSDVNFLLLNFPIPKQADNYDKQSILYIAHILSQTGKGSLQYILKEKNWINGLSAYPMNISHTQDILSVQFELTDSGRENIDTILQYFYAYKEFAKDSASANTFFERLQQAGDLEFTYPKQPSPLDIVEALPSVMKDYPVAQILKVDKITSDTKFDKQHIESLWQQITPSNMRMLIVNKDVITNQTEKYYDIEYKVEAFNDKEISAWTKPINVEFSLPKQNSFMPSKLDILRHSSNPVKPKQISSNQGLEIWFAKDTRFKLPKENIYLLLTSPNMQNTVKNATLQKLLLESFKASLLNLDYDLYQAGVHYDLSRNTQGMIFNINMFSDKETQVLQALVNNIINSKIDDKQFAVYKKNVAQDLENFKHDYLIEQASQTLQAVILEPNWLPSSMQQELSNITINELEQYKQYFLKSIQVTALLHGNITKNKAAHITKGLKDNLAIDAKREPNQPLPKILEVPVGTTTFMVENTHHDEAYVAYAQASETTDSAIAKNALLNSILNRYAYDVLRTDKQLGYVVGVDLLRVRDQPGMVFYAETADKTPMMLQTTFAQFITDFSTTLKNLPEQEFMQYKESTQYLLTKSPANLSEQTRQYWDQIYNQTYRFDFYEVIAKQLDTVDKQSLHGFYIDLWQNPKTKKDITIVSRGWQDTTNVIDINNLEQFKNDKKYR